MTTIGNFSNQAEKNRDYNSRLRTEKTANFLLLFGFVQFNPSKTSELHQKFHQISGKLYICIVIAKHLTTLSSSERTKA